MGSTWANSESSLGPIRFNYNISVAQVVDVSKVNYS